MLKSKILLDWILRWVPLFICLKKKTVIFLLKHLNVHGHMGRALRQHGINIMLAIIVMVGMISILILVMWVMWVTRVTRVTMVIMMMHDPAEKKPRV